MFQRQRIQTASRTGKTALRKGVAAVEMAVCLPVLTLFSLAAIETGEVALPTSILPINSVMIASSNELHLSAFREHPEFNSFSGGARAHAA